MSLATETFEAEFAQIEDNTIRNFAIHVMEHAPPYFWSVPSSSTGKYHSKQSNGEGGLVRHTRAVVYFAGILCRAYSIDGKDKDIVLTACLAHDLTKYGLVMQKYTTKVHDKEAADYVLALGKSYEGLDYNDLIKICMGIAYHFGQWTTHPKAKKFPDAYNTLETIVHLADMCSAGKEVNLEFLQTECFIG